jgi:hypothetical protein
VPGEELVVDSDPADGAVVAGVPLIAVAVKAGIA